MLQNRVDPLGNLIRTPARGTWTGTRGLIHNEAQEIVRPFKLKAWITCKLEFKGRRRTVMSPGLYTELFFLDEATAFAAGHRPCCECRRDDFNKFKLFWLKGNPQYGFDIKTSIREIDAVMHQERIDKQQNKVLFEEDIRHIPDGCFVLFKDQPYLVLNQQLFLWTPFGYEKGMDLPQEKKLTVLTPKSVVDSFRAGYSPQVAIEV